MIASSILAQLEALQAKEYANENKSIQLLHVQNSKGELEDRAVQFFEDHQSPNSIVISLDIEDDNLFSYGFR